MFPAAALLDSLSTAVILLDAADRVLTLNPAAEMLLEQSARRVQGQPLPQLLAGECPLLASLAQARRDAQSRFEHELALSLPHGHQRCVDATLTPLDGEDGHWLLELHPVDRQKRIASESQQLTQSAASRELLRNLAHEIKNPLAGLRGAAQLLAGEIGPDLQDYTRIIMAEADRLRALVDQLLGPHRPAARAPLNIHEVLERVRLLTEASLPPNIRLVRDYDPSLPELMGNADQLTQAVLNIVQNAVQALGERGTITLRTRALAHATLGGARHRLVLKADVIDDGPGVPEALRDRLFLPLVTGRAEGTGLGLSIAQTLAQQHGGLIECDSRPGRTEFSLLLPVELNKEAK
ncbi:MAG: nitrogen regulation protein NR(II) [Gammaproteobacteria bacterium]|nr:nitrogen regulation protein NR(II) [Gammaproteobacteria bacterium]